MVQFKVLIVTYKALCGTGPGYLKPIQLILPSYWDTWQNICISCPFHKEWHLSGPRNVLSLLQHLRSKQLPSWECSESIWKSGCSPRPWGRVVVGSLQVVLLLFRTCLLDIYEIFLNSFLFLSSISSSGLGSLYITLNKNKEIYCWYGLCIMASVRFRDYKKLSPKLGAKM